MGDGNDNVVSLHEARAKRKAEEMALTFAGRLLVALRESVEAGVVCPTHLGDHLCSFIAGALLGAGWTVEQIAERISEDAKRIEEGLRDKSPADLQKLADRAFTAGERPTP